MSHDGSGDACQPTIVITSIRQDGGADLEVHARARDPQGELLYGHVDVIDATPMTITLQDAYAQADCSLGFSPDGAPNEGIGYGNGSLGAPYLFDLNAALGCASPSPNFVLAPGGCDAPSGSFDFFLPLDGVLLPATICVLRIGEPPTAGLEMQVLDLDSDRIRMQTISPHVALRSDFFTAVDFPARIPLAGLVTGTRYALHLTVSDANTVPVSASADFLYQGEEWLVFNDAPTAVIAGGGVFECAGPDGTQVTLDGTGSSDPDSTPGTSDDIASYEWLVDYFPPGPGGSIHGATTTLTLWPGVYGVTLRVTDRSGRIGTATATVTVSDTLPPALIVLAAPARLWPANHDLMPVHVQLAVQDRCDPLVPVTLVSATSSEPDDAPGGADGATTGDLQGVEPGTADTDLLLRAERDARGPGRAYTLTYQAKDAAGNQTLRRATVVVPRDGGGSTRH
jgi:hypothetical protein